MSCFSTEELFEIVFYPLNFFNWISLISSLLFRYSIFKEHLSLANIWSPWVLFGGDEENRTPDPLLARQVLSQLSYTPIFNCWCLARSEGKFLQNWTIQIQELVSKFFLRTMFASLFFFLRKEVIQPHLPIRLPCYDLTPIIDPAFGCVPLAVRQQTSGIPNSHGLTGGVYKARERIHRSMLTYDY